MACKAHDGPVMVVLGHEAEKCRETLHDLSLQITFNPRWEEGMGSSIAHGMAALLNTHPNLKGAVVMLCDQIAVSREVLGDLLLAQAESNADVVLSDYDHTHGPPALFSWRMFPQLLALTGSQGARALWEEAESRATVSFPLGIYDLDTPEQYQTHAGGHISLAVS